MSARRDARRVASSTFEAESDRAPAGRKTAADGACASAQSVLGAFVVAHTMSAIRFLFTGVRDMSGPHRDGVALEDIVLLDHAGRPLQIDRAIEVVQQMQQAGQLERQVARRE